MDKVTGFGMDVENGVGEFEPPAELEKMNSLGIIDITTDWIRALEQYRQEAVLNYFDELTEQDEDEIDPRAQIAVFRHVMEKLELEDAVPDELEALLVVRKAQKQRPA